MILNDWADQYSPFILLYNDGQMQYASTITDHTITISLDHSITTS